MRAARLVVAVAIGWAAVLAGTAASAQDGAVRSHALGRFTFESGAVIDNAHVTYVTWGTLSAAGDNAVLLPSWYGGRALSYQFLVGPDRALDPAKYFIVATEMFKPQAPSPEAVLENSVRNWSTRNLNDAVQLARTWQDHDVSRTPGLDGNIEHALAGIKVPVLYMPGATDLYFPLSDAEYERRFLPNVSFVPIPSLWGHTAGGGGNPADAAFINREIASFLNRR